MSDDDSFVMVPREVTNDTRLSLKAFGLLVFIADKPPSWIFSAKRIASMRPDGEKSVISAIKELESLGYLHRCKRPNGKMRYQLSLLPESGNRLPNAENRQQASEIQLPKKPISQNGKQLKPATISKTQSISKTHYSREIEIPPYPQGGDDGFKLAIDDVMKKYEPTGFDKFWSAYPKKVAKSAAKTAWKRMKCEPIADTIVAVVDRWKETAQWRKDGGQYVPNPTTFLNQQRWDDEIPQTTNPNANQESSPTTSGGFFANTKFDDCKEA